MTVGPVEADMLVYEDFPVYKSGVFKHKDPMNFGGHSVKIIGWGVENNEDYWLVSNSWGVEWGMEGFFKILRGTNEAEIESGIIAGKPPKFESPSFLF